MIEANGSNGRVDVEAAWKRFHARVIVAHATAAATEAPNVDEAVIEGLHNLDVALAGVQKAKQQAAGEVIVEAQQVIRGGTEE